MLNERRRTVLSALVDEYIASVQPVGSKVLVERYHLGCSPATVRSELAALEETGLVFQPHVSAGRIPTDSGYLPVDPNEWSEGVQVDGGQSTTLPLASSPCTGGTSRGDGR